MKIHKKSYFIKCHITNKCEKCGPMVYCLSDAYTVWGKLLFVEYQLDL